jgi:hypothetical protein
MRRFALEGAAVYPLHPAAISAAPRPAWRR